MRPPKASHVFVLLLAGAELFSLGALRRAEAGFTEQEIAASEQALEATEEHRRQATESRIQSVAGELAATAKRHGPDSVALQASLLVHSMQAGAIGVCEVTVVGASPRAGSAFLELDVATGLVFDGESTTERGQRAHVWKEIALPVLEGMKSFQTEPPGLELVFEYGLQNLDEQIEGKVDLRAPMAVRELRVAIPEAVLSDLAVGAIEGDAVLSRSTVHDGSRPVPSGDLVFDVPSN